MDAQNLIDFKDGFAAKNKWIADIALSRISPDLKNITLHLAEFDIPAVNIGSTTTAYKGIAQEIPTHRLIPQDRTITFMYMIDLIWTNYYTLYQWANLLGNIEDITPNLDPKLKLTDAMNAKAVKSIPINVYLINAYKNPILKLTYNNCWIKHFAELSLSYQDEPEVIKHAFTCAYSDFKLERIPQAL
jgi:hypothetical protein